MNESTSTKLSWITRRNLALTMQVLLAILAYFLTGLAALTTIGDFT